MNLPGVYDIFLEKWKDYQTAWIISDTHFDDRDLEGALPDRLEAPYMVKLINSCVGKKDILIHLGDVGDVEWVSYLRGYKVLIMGNHDAGASKYKRQIHEGYYLQNKYTRQQALIDMAEKYPECEYHVEARYDHDSIYSWWYVTADNCLFDEVYEGPVMLGEKLLLSHEPIEVPWAFNIHGHAHNGVHSKAGALNVCIGAEGMGYKPINLNQFLKSGPTAKVQTIHRGTIDKATARKHKKEGRRDV